VPEFGPAETNVTVQREGTAFLDCPVKTAGDRPVSYPLVRILRLVIKQLFWTVLLRQLEIDQSAFHW
jgi:hypothetical protein